MAAPEGDFDGAELAARMAEECADMAEVMGAIQQHFSRVLGQSGAGLDREAIRLFQDMDRVTQTLGDLARLQSGLAGEMDGLRIPRRVIDTALRLKSLSERLSGSAA